MISASQAKEFRELAAKHLPQQVVNERSAEEVLAHKRQVAKEASARYRNRHRTKMP